MKPAQAQRIEGEDGEGPGIVAHQLPHGRLQRARSKIAPVLDLDQLFRRVLVQLDSPGIGQPLNVGKVVQQLDDVAKRRVGNVDVVGQSLQGGVVKHHRNTIEAQLDVELDAVTRRHRRLESAERVLRHTARAAVEAAMGEGPVSQPGRTAAFRQSRR